MQERVHSPFTQPHPSRKATQECGVHTAIDVTHRAVGRAALHMALGLITETLITSLPPTAIPASRNHSTPAPLNCSWASKAPFPD